MQFSHLTTAEVDLSSPCAVLYLFAAAVAAERNDGEGDSCCASAWLGPASTNASVDVYLSAKINSTLHPLLSQGWELTVRQIDNVEPAGSDVLTDIATVRVHSLDEVAAAFEQYVAPTYEALT